MVGGWVDRSANRARPSTSQVVVPGGIVGVVGALLAAVRRWTHLAKESRTATFFTCQIQSSECVRAVACVTQTLIFVTVNTAVAVHTAVADNKQPADPSLASFHEFILIRHRAIVLPPASLSTGVGIR